MKKNNTKSIYMKIGIIVVCASVLSLGFLSLKENQKTGDQKTTVTTKKDKKGSANVGDDEFITIVAVGDIMMGTNYPSESYLPPKDMKLMAPMFEYFKYGDIVFGNLEGTVLNAGGEVKSCSNPSNCYAFRQPEYFLDQLKETGFNMLSVANNHVGDFGATGRKNTIKALTERGFCYAGQTTCPTGIMNVKGLKIGFTAYAPNNGCMSINDHELMVKTVKQLKSTCDLVIVSFHGGAEGASASHVPKKTEIFLGENRGNVTEFARKAIDAGADVVLGHGPHVSRAIDCYKGKFITYSMGNFCTYGRFSLNGSAGIAPLFQLKLKKDGTFVEGKIISITQLGEGGPVFDKNSAALKEIKQLTLSDFPNSTVVFDEEGNFSFE
jgi:poly-gamma-glutamate capsule biosynthesis protein CapA/YwtB (metallophosphatase superfamily)